MPGESPGQQWDAPESFAVAIATAQARHKRKMRARAWTAFVYVVLGLTFLGWLALAPLPLRFEPPLQWVAIGVWLLVVAPALFFIVTVILRRLESRVIPLAERELAAES